MNFLKRYIGDLFIRSRFFTGLAVLAVLFFVSLYIPFLSFICILLFLAFVLFCLTEYAVLFFTKKKVTARRHTGHRFSNGDQNLVTTTVRNEFSFPVQVELIDELPVILQIRSWKKVFHLKPRGQHTVRWHIRPVLRGEYYFGNIHLFVSTPLRLLSRRFTVAAAETIPVYPSFLQLRHYSLLSDTSLSYGSGAAQLRKIGQSMEFEQVKEYVTGDDIRILNWKATARKGTLMVNAYREERSQQVFCILDKGRLMKMPFNGMTLLDYAINSTLLLSNVCLKKQDKVGLITFSNVPGTLLAADSRPSQMEHIMQVLYKQSTDFLESDFEMLYLQVKSKIKHRSLLILFTNFESLSGLNRQIEYLRLLAKSHLLLVVFFENSELDRLIDAPADTIEKVYIKTTAEKFAFEKKVIARELARYGILSILSSPKDLTVSTVNKYLELKARQAI